jgi:hypothetical protein
VFKRDDLFEENPKESPCFPIEDDDSIEYPITTSQEENGD